MSENQYVVGVDYGTLSGRALVVRVSDGAELGSATHAYPHAVLEEALPGSDVRLPPDWALQVPEDYREVLRTAVPEAVAAAGIDPADVIGIAADFTACTYSVRKYVSPLLVMRPRRTLPPVVHCRGTRPIQAVNSRPFWNSLPLPMLATVLSAVAGPTPRISSSRCAGSL